MLFSELFSFLSVDIHSELFVHEPEKEERIPVKIDITLPHLQCDFVGLDIQDEMGRHEVGFVENTEKTPTEDKQGCRFVGSFQVNRVPGNFHISTHSAHAQPTNPDMRHIINAVTFGQEVKNKNIPGSFNPLRNRQAMTGDALLSHDYILKVVPSIYEELSGRKTFSYQYTYAHKEYISPHHGGQIPAVWFKYDLTPITVKYSERRQPVYTFLTTVCAIVGGTFTVAGIIDSFVFTASEFYKKLELGKLS